MGKFFANLPLVLYIRVDMTPSDGVLSLIHCTNELRL